MENLPNEIWKTLDEGLKYSYSISNYGRLIATDHIHKSNIGKELGSLDTYGYKRVSLIGSDNKIKSFKIHRLVAKYFIDGYSDDCVINHIDLNKTNNHVSNLECTTLKDNAMHYIENVVKKKSSSSVIGVGFHIQLKKWTARVSFEGKRYSVGVFDKEQEAIEAIEKFNKSNNKKALLKLGKGSQSNYKYSIEEQFEILRYADKHSIVKASKDLGVGERTINRMRRRYNITYRKGIKHSKINEIETAYNEIKDRKGKFVNGSFIKETDL
ncbi:MAG TPA: NUMOD4 domain-containing protein [Bacteroidia bacterium]